MNANDFVKKLCASAPSIESLREIGLSEAESDSFRAGYICLPRRSPLPLIASNEITDLMILWDVSMIEIGILRLLGTPSIHYGLGVQIGLVESDPILITDRSSEIVVEEVGTAGHVLWKVARSPGQFLDALVLAAKFFTDRAVGTIGFDDLEAAKATANKCSTLAGGDEYTEFYSMLTGAE
jgi:hypothetical protein